MIINLDDVFFVLKKKKLFKSREDSSMKSKFRSYKQGTNYKYKGLLYKWSTWLKIPQMQFSSYQVESGVAVKDRNDTIK